MAFSIFNNIGFFFFCVCVTKRHVCPGSTNFTSEMTLKKLYMKFVFFMAKVSNIDKETNFASIFYSYCQSRSADHKKYA